MNYQLIELELDKIAKSSGVISCALVAIDTGMVCLSTSRETQFEMIAEGARDYWALHNRNGNIFDTMGRVKNIFVQHAKGTICVQACGKKMLLITLADSTKLHWHDWSATVAGLFKIVRQAEIEN